MISLEWHPISLAIFFEHWWDSANYDAERIQHQVDAVSESYPLKLQISQFIDDKVKSLVVPEALQSEFASFSKVNIDAIITTNYDTLLESLFPGFTVFVGQDELIFANPQGIAEIYHIHGISSSPGSLVLTAEDYEDFNERNPYLAAKLLTVFIEHPVIFLGYSISDTNVRDIIKSILRGVRPENVERLKDRLIFVEWVQNCEASVSESSMILDDVSVPIAKVRTDGYSWIFDILAGRERALPARLLRVLKEQVFDLVETNDPQKRLFYTADIADDVSLKDLDVVFGVGARVLQKGIVGLERWELVDDVLDNPSLNLPAVEVLNRLLPKMQSNAYVPIFKYLNAAGLLDAVLADSALPEAVTGRRDTYCSIMEPLAVRRQQDRTISELLEKHGDKWLFEQGLELVAYTSDQVGLLELLKANAELRSKGWWSTQYGKLVIVYDWLRYGSI